MLTSNAKLLSVTTPSGDNYDAEGASTIKWEGVIDCYLEQKIVRVSVSGTSEQQRQWTVHVPVSLDVPFAVGDLLSVRYAPRGYMPTAVTYSVPVQDIAVFDQPDMPDDVCTVALTVEPSAA